MLITDATLFYDSILALKHIEYITNNNALAYSDLAGRLSLNSK